MSETNFDYLLPVFVGHPFGADYTQELRRLIHTVCDRINEVPLINGKRYIWHPEFLDTVESSRVESILELVSESIKQSALCLFEISDYNNNVFLELGIAIGMRRALALLAKSPYQPPSDLQGVRRIEYKNLDDLIPYLEIMFRSRLQELLRPPDYRQDVIYQKMQIDANWRYQLGNASKSMYFIAGDLSWADEYKRAVSEACDRGVTIQICCRRPKDFEEKKWQNIQALKMPGVEIRLFKPEYDPSLRGFIVEPEELTENTEVMLVEKQTRFTRS